MRGTIVRQGSGSWGIRVSAGFDPVTGKRRRVFRTIYGTKKQAEAALARVITEVDSGTELDAARLSVGEYLERWLQHVHGRVRSTTWRRYKQLLNAYVIPDLGSIRLVKVRPTHVQAALDKMLSRGQSPRSVVQCYRVLSSSFRQARRWQLVATNPCEGVQPPRPSRPELRIPSPEDFSKLLDASRGSDFALPLLIDMATGLRRGELLGLRWNDLDLEGARVRVNYSLQRQPGPDGTGWIPIFAEPKTDRARREVALPAFAVTALRGHRKAQAERRLLLGEGWNDLGLVFDCGDGSPVDPDAFSAWFARTADRAGLGEVRLHDVRHGYATALLSQGVHPKVASEALGHSSVAFTLDTYSHVVAGLQQAAAQAIEQAFGGRLVGAETGE